MEIDLSDFFSDKELDEILFENSIEVCGFYMGEVYEKPTRVFDKRIEKLIQEYKIFKSLVKSNQFGEEPNN